MLTARGSGTSTHSLLRPDAAFLPTGGHRSGETSGQTGPLHPVPNLVCLVLQNALRGRLRPHPSGICELCTVNKWRLVPKSALGVCADAGGRSRVRLPRVTSQTSIRVRVRVWRSAPGQAPPEDGHRAPQQRPPSGPHPEPSPHCPVAPDALARSPVMRVRKYTWTSKRGGRGRLTCPTTHADGQGSALGSQGTVFANEKESDSRHLEEHQGEPWGRSVGLSRSRRNPEVSACQGAASSRLTPAGGEGSQLHEGWPATAEGPGRRERGSPSHPDGASGRCGSACRCCGLPLHPRSSQPSQTPSQTNGGRQTG